MSLYYHLSILLPNLSWTWKLLLKIPQVIGLLLPNQTFKQMIFWQVSYHIWHYFVMTVLYCTLNFYFKIMVIFSEQTVYWWGTLILVDDVSYLYITLYTVLCQARFNMLLSNRLITPGDALRALNWVMQHQVWSNCFRAHRLAFVFCAQLASMQLFQLSKCTLRYLIHWQVTRHISSDLIGWRSRVD